MYVCMYIRTYVCMRFVLACSQRAKICRKSRSPSGCRGKLLARALVQNDNGFAILRIYIYIYIYTCISTYVEYILGIHASAHSSCQNDNGFAIFLARAHTHTHITYIRGTYLRTLSADVMMGSRLRALSLPGVFRPSPCAYVCVYVCIYVCVYLCSV